VASEAGRTDTHSHEQSMDTVTSNIDSIINDREEADEKETGKETDTPESRPRNSRYTYTDTEADIAPRTHSPRPHARLFATISARG
jgi:hypothetical protein